jgi:two-component system sensor histidine kinase PilS (NtrC family)
VTGADSESLARKLAVVAGLRIAFVTVSLAAVLVLTDRDNDNFEAGQFTLVAAAYTVSLLYALALRFRVSLLGLAYAQILVDSLLVSILVVTTGGIDSVFTAAYVFVVIGGASTLFGRGATLAVAASLLLLGTLALLQVDGNFPPLPRSEPSRAALSIFTYVISLSLVGGLASALAETARQTGLRLAEREGDLVRLEELHASILRSLPAGLMTLSPAGLVRYANEAALSILQRGADILVEQPIAEVVPPVGRAFETLVRSARSPNPRERYEGAYVTPAGQTLRLGFSFAPLGSREAPSGAIVVFQDVTEIVRLKEAFERAERLATIGKLAAGLAHEVRNPLSSMCASIDVMKAAMSPPEPMRRLMDNVVREGERLNALITDFLRFARPRELNRQPTELGAMCRQIIDVLGHDPDVGRCRLELDVEAEVVVSVDPDMLKQVLWNLVRNAAEAMVQAEQGRPEASLGTIRVGVREAPPFVLLSVTDDGPGMGADVLKRMFDPFFTTKDRGTGLGLAITHSVVEAHGGTILVSSTVGEGTEVVVRLASGGGGELGEHTGDLTAPESLAPISMDERPAGGG